MTTTAAFWRASFEHGDLVRQVEVLQRLIEQVDAGTLRK
jgi:hypothetical protein